MNNYKITFSDLKNIFETLNRGYSGMFQDFLNSFEGKNTFEKFKNILRAWNEDVSPTLNLNLNDKSTKVQFSYIISQFGNLDQEFIMLQKDLTVVAGIPEKFQFMDDFVPIYEVVKRVEMFGMAMDLKNLDLNEKIIVIDNFPAQVYNRTMDFVLREKGAVLTFDNPALNQFHLNFLTNEPYMFLKGLFSNYDETYFRDVIFHLSKRVDGRLLLQSTPLEIEYYIDKYAKEMETKTSTFPI